MPEYLTPGVYLEETSFRSRSIEGVPTSTFGMAGLTRYGPVPYVLADPPVVMVPRPALVSSFTEFERAFGSLDPVGTLTDTTNYLAYAARAFFGNGGQRLYVARVFTPVPATDGSIDVAKNFAALPMGSPAVATWRARWPGDAGNAISVRVGFRRSKNVITGGAADQPRRITGRLPARRWKPAPTRPSPRPIPSPRIQQKSRSFPGTPPGRWDFRVRPGSRRSAPPRRRSTSRST